MADPQLRSLARRINALEKQRLRSKQPTLGFSSIEDGALMSVDEDANLKVIFGKQYDGTQTVNVVSGPVPPQATVAIITSAVDGAIVRWDGLFIDSAVCPLDFARVEVHASTDPDLTADFAATLVGTFETPRGGEVFVGLPGGGTYYFRLVTRSQSGQRSAASAVVSAVIDTVGDLIPDGTDGLVPSSLDLALVARSGILSLDLSWSAHTNPDPTLYDVFMKVGDIAPTGLPTELLTTTGATRLHVTTLPDKTNVVTAQNYSFAIRAKDADGPAAAMNGTALAVAPRLASNAEISADFAYLGEVSFNQMNGGTVGADFILGAKFATATSGRRIEGGPEGLSIHSSTGPRIVLPTDDDQIAMFNGSASMQGLTVKDGLEVRGFNNRFTIGSKVILETKTQGSASPPSVVVDYDKVNLGLNPYLFGITGMAVDEAFAPRFWTEVFFSDAIFKKAGGAYWQPPVVGVNGYFDQRELQPYGGCADVWDATLGRYVMVVSGSKFTSAPSGVATYTNHQVRKYDLNALAMDGSVAPTQVGASIVHPRANGYLSPVVGRNITDREKFVTAEMSGDTSQVILRKWSNATTPVQEGATVTTTAFTDSTSYFRSPKGVAFGRAMDMGFHPSDTTDVFVVALAEDNYSSDEVRRKAYVFNASTGARLVNYDFTLDAIEGVFLAAPATSSGGYSNFIHGRSGDWTKYTNVTWTTEPSTWHATFDWRASAGWKSNMSVAQTFTMKKRARLTVATPPMPSPAAGIGTTPTADDVTLVGIYLGRSTPTRLDMYLQSPTPGTGVTTQQFTVLPTFSGTNPVATTTFPDQASAIFESSSSTNGVPNFKLTGDGFAHFEELDISGAGAASLSGKAFEQLYYSIRAQSQIMGGGVKAVSASYAISWSQRFILISLGNSDNTFSNGNHEIIVPSGMAITNKAITGNVARLTFATSTAAWRVGDIVRVSSVGAPFDGDFTLTAVTSTYIEYALVNANIASTAGTGNIRPVAKGYGGSADVEWVSSTLIPPSWTALYYEIPYGAGSPDKAVSVTNKSLTSNVATLTVPAGHPFAMTDRISVSGVGAPFDGNDRAITSMTATTISFTLTSANVASTAVVGSATPSGKDTIFNNYRLVNYVSDFVVPNNWILLAVRNGDAAAVEWATGDTIEPGFDSDSPVLKQVILNSTTDVTTAAGNKPALRVGDIAGGHIRMDGNELQAMAGNTGTANLALNIGGGNVNTGNASSRLVANGDLQIANHATTTSAANMFMGTGGIPQRVTSSRKVKKDIRDFAVDPEALLSLEPKVYKSKLPADDPTREFVGFIAEEAEALGLEAWVERSEEDPEEVVGFAYGSWVVALQHIARAQRDQISDLTSRLVALEPRVD